MTKNTRLYVTAIAVIVVVAVVGVGTFLLYQGQDPTGDTGAPVATLTDNTGYVLNLTEYPERIVSLAPANTQILFAVGAGDNVVGVTDYCNYPYDFSAWVEAGNMSSIGNYFNPNIEPIVDLNPDLVLASLGSIDVVDQLRDLGYNVLTLNPPDLNGVLDNVILVGQATNHENQATTLVNELQQRIDTVETALQDTTTTPKVYIEIWSDPYTSAGKDTAINELIKLAGGQNIFENATNPYPQVSSEAIIEQNPDIIIFPTSMGEDAFWGSFDEVSHRDGWSNIPAIQNNDLYTINGDLINQPGPRQVDALEALAQIIHPELCGEYTGTT
ncbi:MAG: ABC transporter substrate-binding protein [Candidatus Bathyarchaeota archaeon]|nr:ABC transporter substrate-binding protein [Candidatus Bathyarchaeota archaeon]